MIKIFKQEIEKELKSQKDKFNRIREAYINEVFTLEEYNKERKYNQYQLSYPKSMIWVNLLITKFKNDSKNDMESIMKQNYHSCYIRRVINILTNQFIFKSDFIKQSCTTEVIDFMKLRGIKELDMEKKTMNDLTEVSKKPEYAGLKKRLVRAKYNVIFINKDIEDYMIKSKFEITEVFPIQDDLNIQTTEYFKNHKIYNCSNYNY